MSLSKQISSYEILPPPIRRDPYWREIRRLLWWTGALALFLALISYSPTDSSLTTWSSKGVFKNWMGRLGSITSDLLLQLLGLGAFIVPVLFVFFGYRREKEDRLFRGALQTLIFLLFLSAFLQVILPNGWVPWRLRFKGGIVGHFFADWLIFATGKPGAIFLSAVMLIVSTSIIFHWGFLSSAGNVIVKTGMTLNRCFTRLCLLLGDLLFPKLGISRRPLKPKEIEPSVEGSQVGVSLNEQEKIFSDGKSTILSGWLKSAKKRKERKSGLEEFALPTLQLVSGKADSKVRPVDKNWFLEKANILIQKLKDFGVEGEVANISPGPVITVYEFKPASGVKIKEIANLSDDLTLALSVLSVRIVAPIPGKPVVGIEIPSPHREMVYFKDMIEETNFFKRDLKIPVVMGRLASGEPILSDLASMPHLLIAGTTGTGKSVFINTLICSFVYRFNPEQLKLILVDPKMVELSHYEDIPHLLLPVVVDSRKAALALRWAVEEMERRYTLMHQSGVRHIDAYNEKLEVLTEEGGKLSGGAIPYVVVVIDEYADLMAVVPKDVELSIARLAQKARASGIHLVLATQRPSTDVVTGTIKANFPSRISFRVASSVDSKTILDRAGAERLLGSGDLLFHSAGFTTLKRMQAPFVSDSDIEKIVEYLKTQGQPEYDEGILLDPTEIEMNSGLEPRANELYDLAVRVVSDRGEASISLLQRHLRIGYNRAAMLMEELEKNGVVSESTGPTKRRAVLSGAI